MSAIHTKSLTGITSITTPPGVDNVFTVHSNDTTERFRVDLNGNQSIAGILTVSQDLDVDGHTNLDNVSVSGVSTFSNNVRLLDNDKLQFGDSQDLEIYHDTGSSHIKDTGTGELILNSNELRIKNAADNETMARFIQDGASELWFNNTKRLETTNTGANVTGNFGASGNISLSGSFIMPDSLLHANDTTTRIRFPGPGTFSVDTSGNERLRIASNGDFGFNDTSPTANASGNDTVLSIKGKGSSYSGKIDFKDSSGNIDNHIASDNTIFMFNCDPNSQNGNTAMLFSVHGSERFRFGRHGQLGIAGANYGSSGQVLTSGGSGSAATWSTISGTTINNNADNRVITGSGTANTLEGEANLTFTGSQLNVTGNIKLPDSSAPDYIGNIYVGDNSDLKIFHNGYDNFIRSGAGNHNIRIDNNAGVLGARFIPAGSSELYHNGSLRAYTAFNGFYAEQAEHNDDFDLLIANKFGSLSDNQRCAITCRVTKDAGGSHGGTNRQAVFGHMYNSSTGGGGYYNIRSNDGTNRDFYMDNNTNLRVNYGPSNIGSSNGTVVGSQSSDIRNKNLVGDGTVSYGLSEVLQLNPIKYQYKKELVDRIGFSAQQVEPIIPESVYDTKQDQDNEGNTVSGDTIKAMYYVDLIPVLVNAIKELKAENDALKKRLDDGGL